LVLNDPDLLLLELFPKPFFLCSPEPEIRRIVTHLVNPMLVREEFS
jgi:hypothetical protein